MLDLLAIIAGIPYFALALAGISYLIINRS